MKKRRLKREKVELGQKWRVWPSKKMGNTCGPGNMVKIDSQVGRGFLCFYLLMYLLIAFLLAILSLLGSQIFTYFL